MHTILEFVFLQIIDHLIDFSIAARQVLSALIRLTVNVLDNFPRLSSVFGEQLSRLVFVLRKVGVV